MRLTISAVIEKHNKTYLLITCQFTAQLCFQRTECRKGSRKRSTSLFIESRSRNDKIPLNTLRLQKQTKIPIW